MPIGRERSEPVRSRRALDDGAEEWRVAARYVHVEAVPRRGTRWLALVLRRMVRGDVEGFRRYLSS